VYGGTSPSHANVANWHRKFGCGQESLEDHPREGRPSTALSPENIAAVEALILTDRRIEIRRKKEKNCNFLDLDKNAKELQ